MIPGSILSSPIKPENNIHAKGLLEYEQLILPMEEQINTLLGFFWLGDPGSGLGCQGGLIRGVIIAASLQLMDALEREVQGTRLAITSKIVQFICLSYFL